MTTGLINPIARVERCACGGEIVATRADDVEVVSAVQRHQIEPRHERWAIEQGFDVGPRLALGQQPIEQELARELVGNRLTWGRRAR